MDVYDTRELDLPIPGGEGFKGFFLLDTSKLARDMRAFFNGVKEWNFVVEANNGSDIQLVWPGYKLPSESDDSYGVYRIDNCYDFVLIDNTTSESYDMREDTT